MGRKQEEAARPTFQANDFRRRKSLEWKVRFSEDNGFQWWKNLERRVGMDHRGGAHRGNGDEENMSTCHREGNGVVRSSP